jgi:hypothetical protein
MADIEISEVKTRIFSKDGDTYILDAAFWPQCGFEFRPNFGGGATAAVQSEVMGVQVNSVNLVVTDDGRAFIDVQA